MTKMNNPKFTTPSGDTAPRQVWQQTVDAVLAQTKSQAAGLSSADAAERLNTCGPNALPEKKGKPGWLRFLAHFNDVLIYVLLAAAALTAIMGHWVDTLVILGVTVINALIGHIQESNAEKSLQGIRNMLSSDARVQRNGKHETIPTRDLVPGDIVILRAGDRVPADMRLIETHNLRVEEAILTGESTVVDKITDALEGDLPLGDRVNMVFSGTTVSAGGGVGVVTATGAQTELGHINQMMAGIEKHRTPLLVQMDKLGKAIFAIILAMMVALFIFSLALRDIPMGELLLSLISLAVAAVPEGLPAIISIILSLGVQTMARKRAIIRKLPTVETLGAMTVVCSDKTGTLTMNEMTVKAIITADCCYRVEGDSYEPQGRIFLEGSDEPVQVQPGTVLETWLRTIDLCNDSQLTQDERGLWGITGGPTEGALKVLAAKAQLPAVEARLVAKIPFDSQYKYMSTLQHIDGNARVLITGAPDVIFAMCREQMSRHGAVPFEAQYWEEEMARFARQGLRMVAAACKPASLDATTLNHEDLQEGLIFLGIAGMMDPPRPEAIDAIHACQTAGIRVKMITGDHPQTAMSIGQMLGITNSSQAMTGYQLEHMDDAALALAQAELKSAEASLRQSQQLLTRYERLINNHSISRNDVDTARMQRDVAAAAVQQAKARVEAQQIVLSYTQIAALVTGRVGHSAFHVGTLVNSSSGVLVDIVQLDPVRVSFALDEAAFFSKTGQHADIHALKQAWLAQIEVDGKRRDGVLTSIDNRIDARTGSVAVRAEFANPQHRLLPGGSVTILFRPQELPSRVMVPAAAVQQDPQGFFSWVLKPDHTAGQRRLTLAGQQGQQFAVEKGLQAGEQVITDGAQRLREGAAVQVLN
ncbi:HAD-IC family P-type ATPase [Klebsiella pneumoniae]|nr:HAD-IC family P-type ATPase [Klebsiella pneumoniae]